MVFILVFLSEVAHSIEPAVLTLDLPRPQQVVQRTGIAPGVGYAHVAVRGEVPPGAEHALWEYRVIPAGAFQDINWLLLATQIHSGRFESQARIAAGGWYRLEVRCRVGELVLAIGSVEPFGVGEVFLVAGQSYATNCNDQQINVTDPALRVVAYDSIKKSWAVANDPQPTPVDGSDGGSIWPPLGDALAKELNVPIAFANVAVGGTSSLQWMPEGNLHQNLIQAGQSIGGFRAVLWQQGESDVIAKTSAEIYISNVRIIRDRANKAWGFDPPWLLAKSTLHPTVYNDPEGENRIRGAIDVLSQQAGFLAGPDTDTLKDKNRGDTKSRRHFSELGQRNAALMWLTAIGTTVLSQSSKSTLCVGVAEVDITPPIGFPMAGYYRERLSEGEIDPLKAKALVFRDEHSAGALVVCDLIGIATDLKNEVRQRASKMTGIPESNIAISATHSHTAPDYMKELYLTLGNEQNNPLRAAYIEKLIHGPVDAIVKANAAAQPAFLESGSVTQVLPVSFNRRSITRDGSVVTWMTADHPDFIRVAGPIDPQIGLLAIRDDHGVPLGILSNFALHLDTVGGMKWSADYPFFIEHTLRHSTNTNVISIFGNGCCGDINHVNPRSREHNKAEFIGRSLGESIIRDLHTLLPSAQQNLVVKSCVVQLPLQDATQAEVAESIKILDSAKRKEPVDFLQHVTAYKKLIIDQLRHKQPHAKTADHITWGLSRSLAGIGDTLPVDMNVFTIGQDIAIVSLPGEDFVELGLAIKQGSPFRTTIVIELSNCVESIYVPTRAAYAGGSYEVTNSTTQPGSGELLVESALRLLREAAALAHASRAK